MGSRYPCKSLWTALAVAVVAAASVFVGFVAGGAAPSNSSTLTILYTNQAYGQIRSCNCTKFRYGGYGREATFVKKVRTETGNLVIIEGGDAVGRDDTEQERLKSNLALNAMGAIGYSAFVPGESELGYDRKSLEGWTNGSKTPFILANAKFKDTGKPVCSSPYTIRKLPNGLRVAIVGIVGPELFPEMMAAGQQVDVTDPEPALKSLLPKIGPQADFVIVTAHCDAEKARELAKLSGVNMVLCTHSFDKLRMPAKDENIVEGATEEIGKCIFVVSNSRTGWSVGRLDLEFDGKTVKTVRSRQFYLDRTYDEDPDLVKLYNEYNAKVAEATTTQQNALKVQFEALLKERGIDPSKRQRPKSYSGATACKTCHEEAYDTWTKTRHATALATLQKTGQESDPECFTCHTTGAMQRGGFTSAKDTPELTNVQCESCHGGGVSHAAKPVAGYGAVSEDLCRGCHTEAYNPDFDYEQMLEPISHKKQ